MKNTYMKILAIILLMILSTGCTLKAPSEKNGDNSTSVALNHQKHGEKTGVWSPDSKWVAVTTVAKNRMDTVILDTIENKEYEIGLFKYITEHAENYDYKISGNQSVEPYVNFIEWCPDSKKVLLSYSFNDDYNSRQTGIAVFNLEKMSVDWMIKSAPAEGEFADISKPEDFNWIGAGYGIEAGLVAKDTTTKVEESYNR